MSAKMIQERPIPFSGPEVRAILEGRKTQTRRVVKLRDKTATYSAFGDDGWPESMDRAGDWHRDQCRYGVPGDRLWVKETFQHTTDARGKAVIVYRADDAASFLLAEDGGEGDLCGVAGPADRSRCLPIDHWRPSSHMPRWASRITLDVVSVRVERLQDISEADAMAEGCDSHETAKGGGYTSVVHFAHVWEGINGPGSWDANPWVWVVEFRRVMEGGAA